MVLVDKSLKLFMGEDINVVKVVVLLVVVKVEKADDIINDVVAVVVVVVVVAKVVVGRCSSRRFSQVCFSWVVAEDRASSFKALPCRTVSVNSAAAKIGE